MNSWESENGDSRSESVIEATNDKLADDNNGSGNSKELILPKS